MTVHLISVGLTVLDALARPRGAFAAQPDIVAAVRRTKPHLILETAGAVRQRAQPGATVRYDEKDKAAAADWLASALALPGSAAHVPERADLLSDVCASITPKLWPTVVSAELNTFAAVPDATRYLNGDDIAVLVSSDTPGGLLASVWNAAGLTGGDLSRIRFLPDPSGDLGDPAGQVVIARITGMDVGDEAGFRTAMRGLGAVGRSLLAVAPDTRIRCHLSGGFKAAIPYLIGLAEGLRSHPQSGIVDAYVLHETGDTAIRLPLRSFDHEQVTSELADFGMDGRYTGRPGRYLLRGYAYEQDGHGWRLTAFGDGLRELFATPPGLGG